MTVPIRVAPFALAACLLVPAAAGAQPNKTATMPPVIKTADYTEQNILGDQVVKFTGDELVGPAGGAYGDVIRRPPGIIHVGLIRPRVNFIPELLKSVENL